MQNTIFERVYILNNYEAGFLKYSQPKLNIISSNGQKFEKFAIPSNSVIKNKFAHLIYHQGFLKLYFVLQPFTSQALGVEGGFTRFVKFNFAVSEYVLMLSGAAILILF